MNNDNPKDWKKFKEAFSEQEQLDEESEPELEEEALDNEPKAAHASLEHPSYEEMEQALTAAEQKAHENWEKAIRAVAELENVRRRAERDVENAHRYSLEKFVKSLLAVLDSLEQAIQLTEEHADKAMREGLELTMKLFLDVLAKNEVEQLNPEGAMFDPQQHEAMSMQEGSGQPTNMVLVVCQKGYKLHDRVIRAARVIVAK